MGRWDVKMTLGLPQSNGNDQSGGGSEPARVGRKHQPPENVRIQSGPEAAARDGRLSGRGRCRIGAVEERLHFGPAVTGGGGGGAGIGGASAGRRSGAAIDAALATPPLHQAQIRSANRSQIGVNSPFIPSNFSFDPHSIVFQWSFNPVWWVATPRKWTVW